MVQAIESLRDVTAWPQADETGRAKSDFPANLSHIIRANGRTVCGQRD